MLISRSKQLNTLVNMHPQILLDNMAYAEDDEALQDVDVRIYFFHACSVLSLFSS